MTFRSLFKFNQNQFYWNMKIRNIEKLNYARFHNFSWDSSMGNLSEGINLFFGWNGSGKTTFSKMLRSLETGSSEIDCTFKIKTNTSPDITDKENESIKNNIRVFNDDYIGDILRGSSTIPYIFFAGEEAVNYDLEEQKLKDKKAEYQKIVLPTKHDDIASDTAQLIRETTGINSIKKQLVGGATYGNYNKLDFKKRIEEIDKQIKEEKIENHSDLINADIELLKKQLTSFEQTEKNDNEIIKGAQWLIDNIDPINKVLESTPVQIHSSRIDEMDEVQTSWVEQGIDIHFNKEKPLTNCLFCNSEIKNKDELIKHFSDEVVKIIDSLDNYLSTIENFTTNYAKLSSLTKTQQKNIDSLRSVFDNLSTTLKEKRNSVSTSLTPYVLDTETINSFIDIESPNISSIAYDIEKHYVAQKYEEYKREKSLFIKKEQEQEKIKTEITQLEEQINIIKQKIKNTHEPAKALTQLFKTVFPYRKIEITEAEDGKGYALKRDGNYCNFSSLSEGEKNFIALAYFIYSINDTQNKLPDDGIVVIDDPVSSLDKQAIFQIFSIIVNEIRQHSTRQYLILTHNLDFLGHLKQHYRKQIDENKIPIFSFEATNNGCIIKLIHELLKKHRSDYYYVFSVLAKYKDSCDIADAHLVVNLLRRWLETFLEFKFSTSGDLLSTLETAYSTAAKNTEKWTTPFNANHIEMYRFINHGSHGFNDMESTDDSILSGADQRIKEAFALVKILDNLHYKKLEKII